MLVFFCTYLFHSPNYFVIPVSFVIPVLNRSFLHPNTLRSYSQPTDMRARVNLKPSEIVGAMRQKLPEKDCQCILICDQGYGNEKLQYYNGKFLGLAEIQPDIVSAKNVLIFIIQAVFEKFRMVVSFISWRTWTAHIWARYQQNHWLHQPNVRNFEWLLGDPTMVRKTNDQRWDMMIKRFLGVFLIRAILAKPCWSH